MRKAFAFLFLLLATGVHAEDPDVLWKLVNDRCVPAARAGQPPAPCASVDLARKVAVLKDRNGAYQYLVIPTDKIAGIEDPAILDTTAPFAVAWETRHAVEAKRGTALPRDAISLAVNSRNGRSQNQLHIHVDCLDADTRSRLHGAAIGEIFAPFRSKLAGHTYLARILKSPSLDTINPFKLLADHLGTPIGDWTLVVTGATLGDGSPGFILLASNEGRASGEELQDHACLGH